MVPNWLQSKWQLRNYITVQSQKCVCLLWVYRFFQKLGDVASALQFLVLSKCQEEAFQMAEVYFYMRVLNCMKLCVHGLLRSVSTFLDNNVPL